MIECLDCGTPMEDIIWEKHHGKCKDCRVDPVFDDAAKLKIVTAYLTGTDETQEQVCERIGITVNEFIRWRKQFNTVTRTPDKETKSRRNFTDAEKLNILNGYNSRNYKSVTAYCETVGIHLSMYRKWKIALADKMRTIQPEPETVTPDNIDEVIAQLADMKPGIDLSSLIDKMGMWRTRVDNLKVGEKPAQYAAKILARCLDDIENELKQLEVSE